ncbi:MAG: replication protein [Candidatus Pacebacteria bacterium]|nr:replication protein [Candidatus Paceibacterota bacterium]
MKKELEQFTGFPETLEAGHFWKYPRIMDKYWQNLKGSEQKVLDFILRHTYGFGKLSDYISLNQIEKGVGKLNNGTGLSRPAIVDSLKNLEFKNFIRITRNNNKTNKYELVKNLNHCSKNSLLFASKKSLHTIDSITKDNNTKNKDYLSGKRWGEKPFYYDEEMRVKNEMWYVIPSEGGSWLEFAGNPEEDIEWRKKYEK